MTWWLIFFLLLIFVPFVRYTIVFFIIFIVISILLTVAETFFKLRSPQRNFPDPRPKKDKRSSSVWPTSKDDVEDAQFREEK